MPACAVVQVVHCTRPSCATEKWRRKSSGHFACQAPGGLLSTGGGPFHILPKGILWARGDPASASPHSSTQHPAQADRAEAHLTRFLE